jgi:GxxExxY protein
LGGGKRIISRLGAERKEQSLAKSQRRKKIKEGIMTENEIAKIIVNVAYNIHVKLGPGLLESVYEEILFYELGKHNLPVERQKAIPVVWENRKMEIGFRADIIVDNKVIIELKSIERIAPVHPKQLLTYLRITNLKLGLLINFNEKLIKDGITRIVNNL